MDGIDYGATVEGRFLLIGRASAFLPEGFTFACLPPVEVAGSRFPPDLPRLENARMKWVTTAACGRQGAPRGVASSVITRKKYSVISRVTASLIR